MAQTRRFCWLPLWVAALAMWGASCEPSPPGSERDSDAADAADAGEVDELRDDDAGDVDESDGACAPGGETEQTCWDGKDNDCDGETDCEDEDCRGEPCGVNEGGGGATCRAAPTGGGVECRETECCNCRDDDGDSVYDYGIPEGSDQPVTEAECKSASCQGSGVAETCRCTFDPDEDGNFDTDGSNETGICSKRPTDSTGNCARPDAFESDEATLDDGVDNDCDGSTDEGGLGGPCRTGSAEACAKGICSQKLDVCVHQAFVTSKSNSFTGAEVGGVEAADSTCQTIAGAVGLEGTWKAILSGPSTDAKSRIDVESAVVRTDGTILVGLEEQTLWNAEVSPLQNTLTLDAQGNDVYDEISRGDVLVWTGTDSDGLATGKTCRGWSSDASDETATVGQSDRKDEWWIQDTFVPSGLCDDEFRLYCINGQTGD